MWDSGCVSEEVCGGPGVLRGILTRTIFASCVHTSSQVLAYSPQTAYTHTLASYPGKSLGTRLTHTCAHTGHAIFSLYTLFTNKHPAKLVTLIKVAIFRKWRGVNHLQVCYCAKDFLRTK